MPRPLRSLFLALSIPLVAACPFGGGPTTCTNSVETALQSTSGTAAQIDAGILVTLAWPDTTGLPVDYFQQAEVRPGEAQVSRFTVLSASRAEAEFPQRGGSFSFTVSFPEPDRLGVAGCNGSHGGMADTIELEVQVSALGDAGTRAVSTSANISLGAY